MRAPESRRRAYWVLCLASAAGYIAAGSLVRSDYSRGDFLIFLSIFGSLSLLWAAALALADRSPPTRKLILAAAVAFRLLLLPAGWDWDAGAFRTQILYDDDVWRYLWEGNAWSAGVNPLHVAPEQLEEYELELDNPALHEKLYGSPRWSDVFDNIALPPVPFPLPSHCAGNLPAGARRVPGQRSFLQAADHHLRFGKPMAVGSAVSPAEHRVVPACGLRLESVSDQGIRGVGSSRRSVGVLALGGGVHRSVDVKLLAGRRSSR